MRKISLILIISLILSILLSGCSEEKKVVEKPSITQIRSICNLATLECYYHNVAKSTKKAGSGLSHIGEIDREFWIEYTGSAKIGIDMSKVTMQVKEEKISVFIPEAKLLSINIKQIDKDSFIYSGDSWFNNNEITAEDETKAIKKAQENMKKTVVNNSSLMMNAQNRAKDLIESYIKNLGEISGVKYKIEWKYGEEATKSKN